MAYRMLRDCHISKLSNSQNFVDVRAMKKVFLVALVLVVAAGYFLWPKSVVQEVHGKTQAGVEYRAICASSPASLFSMGNDHVRKLELILAGSSRNVPSAALENCGSIDTKRQLQVFEEGPVLVVTTFAKGGGSIQWRFLNGQFAQRRILKAGQQDVRNFQAAVDRPSIIAPPPQGSARTLHSPSLLSSPDKSTPPIGNR
ncbi:MAG: hypothetical protein WC076_07715 [Terrimicrobiaceae bacterium]